MEVSLQQLQARIEVYDDSILLTRRTPLGYTCYPIAPEDLAGAFDRVPLSSGVLPANGLFWQRQEGQERIGLYVPARRWRVMVTDETLHIPLPPMVFVGCGVRYEVHAVRKRPKDEHTLLYHLPAPNVNGQGVICAGNTPFPPCQPDTILAALHLFLEGSGFNNHLANGKCRSQPENVLQLWHTLNGKLRFPREELLPQHRTLWSVLRNTRHSFEE